MEFVGSFPDPLVVLNPPLPEVALHRQKQCRQVEPAEQPRRPADRPGERHAGEDHAAQRLSAPLVLSRGSAGLRLRPRGQVGPGGVPRARDPLSARAPDARRRGLAARHPASARRRTTASSRSSWPTASGRCSRCSRRRTSSPGASGPSGCARSPASSSCPTTRFSPPAPSPARGIAELAEALLQLALQAANARD